VGEGSACPTLCGLATELTEPAISSGRDRRRNRALKAAKQAGVPAVTTAMDQGCCRGPVMASPLAGPS